MELVAVILILGLAVERVAPRLGAGAMERAKLRRITNQIANTAAYARELAASTRRMHRLHIDLSKQAYWLTWVAPRAAQQADAEWQLKNRTLRRRRELPDDVRFTGVAAPNSPRSNDGAIVLRFSPEGWADSAAIYLIGADGETRTVLVRGFLGRTETHDGLVKPE